MTSTKNLQRLVTDVGHIVQCARRNGYGVTALNIGFFINFTVSFLWMLENSVFQ